MIEVFKEVVSYTTPGFSELGRFLLFKSVLRECSLVLQCFN